MKINSRLKEAVLACGVLASMVACGPKISVRDYPDTASAADEVKNLNSELATALKGQVNILSPNNYRDAVKNLESARSGLEKQKDSRDILHDVAEGHAYLDRANKFAQVSRNNMEDVVAARQNAVNAQAPSLFADEFNVADRDLVNVTTDIEDNNTQTAAEKRGELQAEYMNVELKAIKKSHLDQAAVTITNAVKEGAKTFAPRSLALAEKDLKDTDAYITANRHNTAQVDARSSEALATADHLLKITREAKSTNKASPEDLALRMEGAKAAVQEKQTELNQQAGATQALSAENQKLQAQQALEKTYETARSKFSANEAEVYKEGDKLLIRLKGLQFPEAKADLRGASLPLLAKVDQVIQSFGKSAVTVEGHTDSIGGKVKNQKLSTERAQAVKEYLTSAPGASNMTVEAVGYGYQKPLASNKTARGRAQNRRVDVIIQPEKATM